MFFVSRGSPTGPMCRMSNGAICNPCCRKARRPDGLGRTNGKFPLASYTFSKPAASGKICLITSPSRRKPATGACLCINVAACDRRLFKGLHNPVACAEPYVIRQSAHVLDYGIKVMRKVILRSRIVFAHLLATYARNRLLRCPDARS